MAPEHGTQKQHADHAEQAFSTLTIHGGQRVDPTTGAVFPPLYTSST